MFASQNLELFSDLSLPLENKSNIGKGLGFIDLFAGIGGFHLALQSMGGHCVFASEKDPHARVTYLENFDIPIEQFNDDIRKISPEHIPDHDVLCAGFPCQPFSQAGLKKGFQDGENSERGNLFYCILEILEAKRPRAFILENVRHLIAHDDGNTFATILKHLHNANYEVSYKVIKASDFNVPQHRARVFIVGFDRTKLNTDVKFHFPIPLPLTKTMSDIFHAPCEKKIGFTLRVGGKGSRIDDRRNWEFYYVNGQVQRIGLKEAQEMMTFPVDFKFPVSKTQAMKQLGNSVCVEVVKAVSRNVFEYINQNSKPEINEESMPNQNKGEISENYALLKIIVQRLIHYGNAEGLTTEESINVLKINTKNNSIHIKDINVDIVFLDGTIKTIQIDQIITEKELSEIPAFIKRQKGTFNSDVLDDAIKTLGITQQKGSSKEKADISLDFKDEIINANQGIGIKSFLGNPPTLLNASQATNFVFKVKKINTINMDAVNRIETSSKIKDRVQKILELGGELSFSHCENETYESNLRKCDSQMPEILADALLSFFNKTSTKHLSAYNPQLMNSPALSFDEVHCRLRDFVKNTLLGIFPSDHWDGELSAHGAIVVTADGELVFYHTNQEKNLKNFFYQHTIFDTPSSTKHRFGHLYKENNELFFKLNLQLRLAL